MGKAEQTQSAWIDEQSDWTQNKTYDMNNINFPKKEVQCIFYKPTITKKKQLSLKKRKCTTNAKISQISFPVKKGKGTYIKIKKFETLVNNQLSNTKFLSFIQALLPLWLAACLQAKTIAAKHIFFLFGIYKIKLLNKNIIFYKTISYSNNF